MTSAANPRALWLPYQVTDLERAVEFYTDRLGLSVVDGWRREGERGTVLAAGTAFVELVTATADWIGPVAYEFDSTDATDAVFARLRPTEGELLAPPHRYPRGHHGFEVRGPAGASVMIWSER